MKEKSTDPLIDVSQLKLGMFIHLDLGWMSHPFPLSSFKLVSDDQLLVLNRLGLSQVRWSPSKSDLHADATLIDGHPPVVATSDGGAEKSSFYYP